MLYICNYIQASACNTYVLHTGPRYTQNAPYNSVCNIKLYKLYNKVYNVHNTCLWVLSTCNTSSCAACTQLSPSFGCPWWWWHGWSRACGWPSSPFPCIVTASCRRCCLLASICEKQYNISGMSQVSCAQDNVNYVWQWLWPWLTMTVVGSFHLILDNFGLSEIPLNH